MMLQVKHLKKTYKTKNKKVEAVKDVSFNVKAGEIFALLGPNGAGKTTTIKSILGLVIPDEGEIIMNNLNVRKHTNLALKYMTAVLEGNRNIHWRLKVKENLEYFGGLRGLGGKKLKERIKYVVEYLELSEKYNEIAGKLSRGYQQRLAIAIALLPDTPLILLDEPTLGLDVHSSLSIRKILKDLINNGKTVLLSTHDMNLVEAIADRVLIIDKGKVIALDKKENLMNMFRSKAYKIVLKGKMNEEIKKRIEDFGDVNIELNGKVVIDVQFDNSKKLFDLFDILKNEDLELESIEPESVNFEKVFIKIIEGGERS